MLTLPTCTTSAGTGFCGLVAAHLARSVVLADREPHLRELATRNAANQDRVRVEAYGWGDEDPWPASETMFVYFTRF